jgi:tetratricopeptide (TPR) repeat protein
MDLQASQLNIDSFLPLINSQKLEFHSDLAREAFLQGVLNSQNEDWQGAVEAFRKLAKLEPSPNNLLLLGIAYYKAGNPDRSIKTLEKAIELGHKDYEIHVFLGLIYVDLNKLTKAIKFLRNATHIKPNEREAYFHLGYAYSKLKQWQLAISSYEKAIKLDKNFIHSHLYLAALYTDLGIEQETQQIEFFNKAITTLMRLLEIAPNHIDALNHIGDLHYTLGNLEEAEKKFSKVLELDPHNADALNQLRMVKEDQLAHMLLESGSLKRINKRITDFTPYQKRKPIKIKGKPLSETVIEDRR